MGYCFIVSSPVFLCFFMFFRLWARAVHKQKALRQVVENLFS